MKKSMKKIMTAVSGATMLTSAVVSGVSAETEVKITEEVSFAYDAVANVQGNFSFNQNTVTPSDEVFNIFGTAVTGICAKPDVAFASAIDKDHYINVSGKISYAYTASLKDLAAANASTRTMLCACATGAATAQANITGIKLVDVLELAKLDEDANVIAVKSADGYTQKFALSYLMDHEAMLAYKIGDKDIESGVQLWVPSTVAKYFVRDVAEIEVLSEAQVPEMDQRNEELQAEIALMNTVEDKLTVGKAYTFEGYADDLGDAIAAVEFSMDGGETWTAYNTPKASPDLWVYWTFEYTPEAAGSYQLSVRARTASGKVSPLAANVSFTVVE